MAFLGSNITSEVGLRLLLCPLGSNIVLRTACCSVGVVVPVYSTYKAIEGKNQNEQQKWLVYWAAYGSFTLLEVFADKLISWVPMYYHVKFAFVVWLQLPSTDGAQQLYRNHLLPFFLRHQARVDLLLGITYCEMVKIVSAHRAEIEYAKALLLKIMGTGDYLRKEDSDHSRDHPTTENQNGTIARIESDLSSGDVHGRAIEQEIRRITDTESEHDD